MGWHARARLAYRWCSFAGALPGGKRAWDAHSRMSAHRLLTCLLLALPLLACQAHQAPLAPGDSLPVERFNQLINERPRCASVVECTSIASREPALFSFILDLTLPELPLPRLLDGFEYQHERPAVTRIVHAQVWTLLESSLKEAAAHPSRQVVPSELMERMFVLAEQELRSPGPERFPVMKLLKALAEFPQGRAWLVQWCFSGEDAVAVAASLVLVELEPEPTTAKDSAVSSRAIEVIWRCFLVQRPQGSCLPELAPPHPFSERITQAVLALPVFHSRLIALIETDAEQGSLYPGDLDLYEVLVRAPLLEEKLLAWSEHPSPTVAGLASDRVVRRRRDPGGSEWPRVRRFLLRYAASGRAFVSLATARLLGHEGELSAEEVAQVIALSRSSSKDVRLASIHLLVRLTREHGSARLAVLEVLQRDEVGLVTEAIRRLVELSSSRETHAPDWYSRTVAEWFLKVPAHRFREEAWRVPLWWALEQVEVVFRRRFRPFVKTEPVLAICGGDLGVNELEEQARKNLLAFGVEQTPSPSAWELAERRRSDERAEAREVDTLLRARERFSRFHDWREGRGSGWP